MSTDPKSPLLEKKVPVVPTPKYTEDEETYLGRIQKAIFDMKTMRDQPHDEFDGQTYLQYCEANRKGSNTYIEPKKNKEDTNFASGTIRQKMMAYLASLNNLDLTADVQAFDEQNQENKVLGEAVEDITWEVGQQDNDDEKKLLRQYELLEQGTVFVEEGWEVRNKKAKTTVGKFDGTLGSVSWTARKKKDYEGCTRKIMMGENVYLGDIRQFDMHLQPRIATVEIVSWEEAKSKYGDWERFQYVPKVVTQTLTDKNGGTLYSPVHFYDHTLKNEVEIIKYQDAWNDEFMVLCNGVMMHPVGYPLSAETPTGGYTVVKQVYEVINSHFAYGKSLVARMKTNAAILDEMMRMAVLKTQKSFAPAMANNTGRVLTSRIFAPGKITIGIDPTRLQPIDPNGRPVEGAEFNMIEMLQRNIDRSSVDPSYQGQNSSGTQTATQVLELQRQAKLMIGLTVFVASLLEQKLTWARLDYILKYWFAPTEQFRNEYGGEGFLNRYRSVNRPKMIPGAGMGRKITRLADQIPADQEIYDAEEAISTPEEPIRIVYLSPELIKSSRYMWYISVVPKEKKTDALSKVMFGEMMDKAMAYFGPNLNQQYMQERFAEHWNENPNKMFTAVPPAEPDPNAMPGADITGDTVGVPNAPKQPPAKTAITMGGATNAG